MEPFERLREMEWFAARVREGRYALSEHVIRFLMAGEIGVPAIEAALLGGQVIEEHRHARRGTSYLVCGAFNGRAVHVVCAPARNGWLVVAHAYVPAPPLWITPARRNPGARTMTQPLQECFFCAGEIKQITVGNFDYRLEGQLYVIKKVPAGLCQQCGEKYIDAAVGQRLNDLIGQRAYTGTEAVQVIDYEQAP